MKRSVVAVAFLPFLVVMGVGAWLGYDTPPPSPAAGQSVRSEGSAHFDAGPCNANDEARALGCCFSAANAIRGTVGVGLPDAGVVRMPLCRGGQ